MRKIIVHSWIVTAALASFVSMAQAQLVNCKDPGPPDSFKIFVDEVRWTGGTPSDSQTQDKLVTIHKFLTENLKASSGLNASVRDCGKRFPNDASDFDSTEFDGLDNLRVLLEVWGVLDNPAKGTGSVGFALVPARQLSPPAIFVVPSTNLLNSLRQGKQVSGFAPLVQGIRQYQNHLYAESVPLLCAGTQHLNSVFAAQSALSDPSLVAQQQELIKKVKQITDSAIREGRKTPGSPFLLWNPSSDGSFLCPQ